MSYDNETPMNDKFLMKDGSIKNANRQTISDVRDCVDVTQNGLLISQKGTAFKSANVNVEGGSGVTKLYAYRKDDDETVYSKTYPPTKDSVIGHVVANGDGSISSNFPPVDSVTADSITFIYLGTFLRDESKDITL